MRQALEEGVYSLVKELVPLWEEAAAQWVQAEANFKRRSARRVGGEKAVED
jgi:hypothetical protein